MTSAQPIHTMQSPVKAVGKSLTREDIASLEARWIDRELAIKAQIRRVDAAEARDLLGRGFKENCAGLYIPYLRPGDGVRTAYRIRRDNPEKERKADGRLKDKNKYLGPPDQRNQFYYPPEVGTEVLRDVNTPVLVTEGEFKTLAGHRLAEWEIAARRWLTVGLGGVWGWKGTVGKAENANGVRVAVKDAIRDFNDLSWKGRRVVLAFDADQAHNGGVQAALNTLTRHLQKLGAKVGRLTWDLNVYKGAKGLDDWLAVVGPEIALKHIEAVDCRARATNDNTGFRMTPAGVVYVDPDSEKGPVRVCGKLQVVARTRSRDGDNWGLLLRWEDPDEKEHLVPIPMAALANDGTEVRQLLAGGGLYMGPGPRAKSLLIQYLQTAEVEDRVTCVEQVGWHDGTFIGPRGSVGPAAEEIVLQNMNSTESLIREAGTLAEWKRNVATLCQGNSRLILTVCAALAGPTLNLLAEESGGFHIVGKSSTGKSTALVVGGSVLGGGGRNGFVQSWRNTANGLEAIAAAHNDVCLFLDELAQMDPKEAAETAYLLGNGSGKGRMTKSVTVRPKATWSLLFVSAGETTLADHALSVGKVVKGGVEVRLLNISADAGRGLGAWENTHRQEPAAFSRHLKEVARQYYGTALTAWLNAITESRDDIEASLRRARNLFVKSYCPVGAVGEVVRAVERFALVAAAGEVATVAGVLPWPSGEASKGVGVCLRAWLGGRGTVQASDDESAVRVVRMFLEQYGSGRFQRNDSQIVPNRAGFIRGDEETGGLEYLILAEVFRHEVCKGFDVEMVAKVLDERGFLGKHEANRWTDKPRIAAIGGTARVYTIKGSILE